MKSVLNFKTAAFTLIAAMILTSCSQSDQVMSDSFIQKRKYNKGFFIAKKSTKNDKQVALNQKNEAKEVVKKEVKTNENNKTEKVADVTVTASTNSHIQTVEAKPIQSVTSNETTASKAAIASSKKVEKLIEKAEKAQEKQNLKEGNAPEAAAAPLASGKSQIIALILCAFVGGIGIHRFYLGYTWQGIVQLLTFGACGIWTLIDFIRIITGDLTPKSGRYSKTL